jgi:hypothetical protein
MVIQRPLREESRMPQSNPTQESQQNSEYKWMQVIDNCEMRRTQFDKVSMDFQRPLREASRMTQNNSSTELQHILEYKLMKGMHSPQSHTAESDKLSNPRRTKSQTVVDFPQSTNPTKR